MDEGRQFLAVMLLAHIIRERERKSNLWEYARRKKKSACVYVFLWSGIHDLSSTQRAVINLYIVILVDLSWNCWFVLTSATSWRSLFCHSSRHYFEPVAVVATCILFFVAGTLFEMNDCAVRHRAVATGRLWRFASITDCSSERNCCDLYNSD